jgi:hypothetical protein
MKNKKLIPVVVVIMAIILAGGGIWAVRGLFNSSSDVAEETTKKKKVLEPKNIIALNERPFVILQPSANGHYLDLEIVDLKKPADEVEVELEYQAGSLLQGFQDTWELGELPLKQNKLFGSQSAGGAITYHEDIKGGSLQLRFLGDENYVLKQDWRMFDTKETEGEFASKDGKFQLTSKDLADSRFVIVYETPGVPEGLEGEQVSQAYLVTAGSNVTGVADISIRADQEENTDDTFKLMGYDGETWTEIEAEVDGKMVTVTEADLMEVYVVVN